MKRLFTLFLFVFALGVTQTSVAVDSHDGEKPQIETSVGEVDVSTPVNISDDLVFDDVKDLSLHDALNLKLSNEPIAKKKLSAIRHQSDTNKRLDKLFRKANKSFTAKFNRRYGKFKTKTILKYPIRHFKNNLIRSPDV